MSDPGISSEPRSFNERVYAWAESVFNIGKDHPKRYLISSFLSAVAADRSGILDNVKDARVLITPLAKAIREELLVDNISHFLMVRKVKKNNEWTPVVTIQEALKETVSKLCAEYNIIINASPFTVNAVKYLQEKSMAFPHSMSLLPAEIATESIDRNNCEAIFVYALSREKMEMVQSRVYNASDLMLMARKRIDNGVVIDLNTMKHDPVPLSSPWSGKNPTDFVEMLRKTAIKNFIKYFSLKA